MSLLNLRSPKHTHSDRLDRWLGPGQTEVYSKMFREWHGPPVALAGVPGAVYVAKGGDFVGPIEGGGFANLIDFAEQRQRRIFRNFARRQSRTLNAGFASLSDLISEADRQAEMAKQRGELQFKYTELSQERELELLKLGMQERDSGELDAEGNPIKKPVDATAAMLMDGLGKLGEALDKMHQSSNAPVEVVRGPDGKMIGARRVVN